MKNPSKVYVTAPASIWSTDRYELMVYLVYHRWPSSTIIERRDALPDVEPGSEAWQECVKKVAALVFIRDESRSIDASVWAEINHACSAGKDVHLARMHKSGFLILIPHRDLEFVVGAGGDIQVGYAKPAKKQEKVEAKA